MKLFRLAWKNLWQKPLSSVMSLLLLSLGVAMISALLIIGQQMEEQFSKNIKGIDMVVGAKGSPLQIILSSIYHIDSPTGNINLAEAEKLLKNPMIEKGIPLSFGDNYKSYRIVGTNQDYPEFFDAEIESGRLWEGPLEATVGYRAAADLDLKVGSTFVSSHGLLDEVHTHDNAVFAVVGILSPNNSVIDQLILTSTESIWKVHADEHHDHSDHEGHDHEGHDHEGHDHSAHDHAEHSSEDREITSMLVKFRSKMAMMRLPRMINESTDMQAALPAIEVNRLFSLLGIGLDTLRWLAMLIMFIAGISVFISLFNSLKERIYEMALIRTLGGTRTQLAFLVVCEGLILTFIGFFIGVILSRVAIMTLSKVMDAGFHYTLNPLVLQRGEGLLFIGTLILGIISALIPAIKAFNVNLSKTLSHA